MRIIDSKFIEHQAFASNWSEARGGKFTFKNSVPPGYSIHAGMYLNIECDVQIRKNILSRGNVAIGNDAGGDFYRYSSFLSVPNPYPGQDDAGVMFKVGECSGLPFQQSITEVKIKINNKGVQRYRNRTFLRDYVNNIVGNNVHEINDGYKIYKAGGQKSKVEDKLTIDHQPNNRIAFNNYIEEINNYLHNRAIGVIPGPYQMAVNNPGNGQIADASLVLLNAYFKQIQDSFAHIAFIYPYPDLLQTNHISNNVAAFNAWIQNTRTTLHNLPGGYAFTNHVDYVEDGAGIPQNLAAWNVYIAAMRGDINARQTPPVHVDMTIGGDMYDNRKTVLGDSEWRNNANYVSRLMQFNQVSRGYNADQAVEAVADVANTLATYKKMSPLFAPPFTRLGNVHGNLRGDNELSRHSELLPGIKDYEIQLSLPNGRDLPRGWLEVFSVLTSYGILSSNRVARYHSLRIKNLKISLVVQYTKLDLSPPLPVYYPAIATEIYSSPTVLLNQNLDIVNGGVVFDLPLIRIGRIPKYLIIAAMISRDGSKEFPTGIDEAENLVDQTAFEYPYPFDIWCDVFQTNYLTTGGPSIESAVNLNRQKTSEANMPNAEIIELIIERSAGGDVLFRKTLTTHQLYWITKRSVPCREKFPYDANSFILGRGAICLDTTLCGLEGNYANGVGLFEMKISAKVRNLCFRPKSTTLNCTCVYTNYGFHLKSNSFDYVEKHG